MVGRIERREMKEFIPTLGNLIKACDSTLEDVPEACYATYAGCFENTKVEAVIFSGTSFEEAASQYCRNMGWQEPR